MNLEFHYYTLYYLSVKAGFGEDEAEILSWSSQMVDNHLSPVSVQENTKSWRLEATQDFSFWEKSVENRIYKAFHFPPGHSREHCKQRCDGHYDPEIVAPDSPGIKKYLIDCFKSGDLYRMGIALHTYADSWAHQHFTGGHSSSNVLDSGSLLPPIGHAQAQLAPDDYWAEWEDPRLQAPLGHVVNRQRFREAARMIYRYLCVYKGKPFKEDEEWVLDEWQEYYQKSRGLPPGEDRMLDLRIAYGIPQYDRGWLWNQALDCGEHWNREEPFRHYGKFVWFREKLRQWGETPQGLVFHSRGNFEDSGLYKWWQAAELQRAWFLRSQSIFV